MVVTYTTRDNCVRFWQPYGGLFGAFVGSVSSGVDSMRIFREFNVGRPLMDLRISDVLKGVRFEWISERGVKMMGLDGLELTFAV
jgi:hypothetical protein